MKKLFKAEENITIDSFTNKLNKIITEKKFKENMQKLLNQVYYNKNGSAEIHKNWALFTSKMYGITYDLKITLTDNEVSYVYNTSDIFNNEAGTFKNTKNHTFTNVFKYTFENYEKVSHLRKTNTISIFNKNLVEQFKYVAEDYQSYSVENGKKTYLPNYQCLAFNNVLNIKKQIRTKEDNIIQIIENKYYNDNMRKNDSINYSIAPNINNDYFLQLAFNSKPDYKYIPYGGEYNEISHEKYLKYMHSEISDEELFENYKSLQHQLLF